jgi:hypothetical protein
LSEKEKDAQLVRDLEHRIETLENMDDAEFGAFTRLDYFILIIGAAIVPVLALVLAR